MQKGINYWAFPLGRDGSAADPLQAMQTAHALGFDCFEVTVDAAGPVSPSTTFEQAQRLRQAAQAMGLRLMTGLLPPRSFQVRRALSTKPPRP